MNSIIESMLINNNTLPLHQREYQIKEIIQELSLYILSKSDFFNLAAFYGGTALRIFYHLDRFSEDLDFSLKTKDRNFNMEKYLNLLKIEFKSMGLLFEIEEKEKKTSTNIKSAFIKANTKELIFTFYNADENLPDNRITKIKLEIDINPPLYASFETKFLLKPLPFEICAYDLPSLFAGKIHAILCRLWKNRVKGRDLYDYIFYISNNVKPNMNHLKTRLVDSGYMNANDIFDESVLKDLLVNHFNNIDVISAKEDVRPFLLNPESISIWSNDFFTKITQDYFK